MWVGHTGVGDIYCGLYMKYSRTKGGSDRRRGQEMQGKGVGMVVSGLGLKEMSSYF